MLTRNFGNKVIVTSGSRVNFVREERAIQVGKWYGVILPNDVLDYMHNVDVGVMTLQNDLSSWFTKKWGTGPEDPKWPNPDTSTLEVKKIFLDDYEFAKAWNLWFKDWKTFYATYSEKSTFGKWVTSNSLSAFKQVEEYDVQFQDWRKRAAARGTTIHGSDINPPGGPPGASSLPWTTIAVIGAVGVLGYFLVTK